MGVSRLFIAIPISDSIRKELAGLKFPAENVNWVPDHQLHLTLKFVGETNSKQAEVLAVNLGTIRFSPFDITLKGIGTFPVSGSPRVLWTKVMAPDALSDLHQKVSSISESCGANADKHPFKPHVTLARIKDSNIRRENLLERLKTAQKRQFGTMTVDQFILYKSILDKTGAAHIALHKFHSLNE